jgi:hypothetical protein
LGLREGRENKGSPKPAEAWERLEFLHVTKSFNRRLGLREALGKIKMQKNEKVLDYWGKGERLKRDLRICGAKMEEEEWVAAMLNGLPEDWRPLRMLIKEDPESLKPEAVLRVLLDEEDNRIGVKVGAGKESDGGVNAVGGGRGRGNGGGRGRGRTNPGGMLQGGQGQGATWQWGQGHGSYGRYKGWGGINRWSGQ